MENTTSQPGNHAGKHKINQRKTSKALLIKKRKDNWLEAYVPYGQAVWLEAIKNIEGRKWDPVKTCWLLPYVKQTFYHLRDYIKLYNILFDFKIDPKIPEDYMDLMNFQNGSAKSLPTRFDELKESHRSAITQIESYLIIKRYSYQTIKVYRHCMIGLFHFYKKRNPQGVYPSQVQNYILHQIKAKRMGVTMQHQVIIAYKIYAEKILNRPKEFIEIPRPRRAKKLPGILSSNEVVRLIKSTSNLKHKTMLMLIYSSGLRGSEIINMLKRSVQIERRAIHIKGAKGKKDRYVVLAETIVPYLKKYLEEYKPQRWLFEGQTGGPYSIRSLQQVFNKAMEKSGVDAYATLHTLRHSYATHCLENGHNLKSIQQALGHKSLKTTEVYLHLASDALKKLESPMDGWKF